MKKALKRTLRDALLKSQSKPKKSSRMASITDNPKQMSIIKEDIQENEDKEMHHHQNVEIDEIKLESLPMPEPSKAKTSKVFKKGAIKFIKK